MILKCKRATESPVKTLQQELLLHSLSVLHTLEVKGSVLQDSRGAKIQEPLHIACACFSQYNSSSLMECSSVGIPSQLRVKMESETGDLFLKYVSSPQYAFCVQSQAQPLWPCCILWTCPRQW
eukprot:290136-Pelagomonas_calceolata.AAC.1